jgi:hypothetical protein
VLRIVSIYTDRGLLEETARAADVKLWKFVVARGTTNLHRLAP